MTDLVATYRLQLGPNLDFPAVRALVPYLGSLGISHLYLSPILRARKGSTHGYDVIDPTLVSDELGGEDAFRSLARAGLSVLVDIVPNHMATDPDNPYWNDPALRARFFDVDEQSGFHRRFFDIDELAGVRQEDEHVFNTTHAKIGELIADGLVQALRVDHIDGLADPKQYLERLADFGAEHVFVEKILEPGEELRNWPISGTTGYEAMADLTALFVDPHSEPVLAALTGEEKSFSEIAFQAKREQVATTFRPEVQKLSSLLEIRNIAEALSSLPVYRTYVRADRREITDADRRAMAVLPEEVRAVLSLEREAPAEFVTRFQQSTGAVMAKGVEDTALYRDVRLLALNEVGANPGEFGIAIAAFHAHNVERARRFPHNLVPATTHDTKRSGDVRARLVALSHLAPEWADATRIWHEVSADLRQGEGPDLLEEHFVYQTLIGAWPITSERLGDYLRKALREAKRNSNWTRPNEAYESQVIDFATGLITDEAFLETFLPLQARVGLCGEQIALAQCALRFTMPGVPDLYQGDETWNYSLVDPDNRRPVAWNRLTAMLDALETGASCTRANAKLFATTALLGLRRRRLEALLGRYEPLDPGDHLLAYRRGDDVVVIVNVRNEPLAPEPPGEDWVDLYAPLRAVYPELGAACYERLG